MPFGKPLPDTPPDSRSMSEGRGGRFNSWNMFVPHARLSRRGQPTTDYYVADGKEQLSAFRGPSGIPKPPDTPPMAYGVAGQRTSMEMIGAQQTTSQQTRGLVPPSGAQPPARRASNLDIYPPGQVPIGNFRVPSMARTNTSDNTEGTWRTWNVDQRQTSKDKRPWKERYLG